MVYLYDGTFLGFLTTIFDAYKVIEKCKITVESNQINFFEDVIRVVTDEDKAKRVRYGIESTFSKLFYKNFYCAFLSFDIDKEDIMARTLKEMYANGREFLNSSNYYPVNFNRILKNVSSENHSYMGLLRFREIQDGFLYAAFRPKNDIIELLTPHFIKRLPKENFIIHDKGRGKCVIYKSGICEAFFVEELNVEDSKEEEFFREAWKLFYNRVSIKERENKKLMTNNMPKIRWEFLPERV